MGMTTLSGNVRGITIVEKAVDIGSVAANTTEEEEVTIPGVKVGDFVAVMKPSLEAGLIFGTCRVSAADTVQITVGNFTGGAINEASETLRFLVVRMDGLTAASRVID